MVNRKTIFAKRLKTARLKLGISQMKLGMKTGLDEHSANVRMSQYEVGTSIPRFDVAIRIAQALNVPTSYLYEPDETMAKIILDLNKLNNDKRKIAAEYIKKLADNKS